MTKPKYAKYEPLCGTSIDSAAWAMIELARQRNLPVRATFNGIKIEASRYNTIETVVACFHVEMIRRNEAYNNSPAAAEAQRKAEEHRERYEAAIAEGFLAFSVKDQELWDRVQELNLTGMGLVINLQAARWAHIMEAKMAEGAKLEDIAAEADTEADLYGASGFMYGAMVLLLSEVWEHGETLRHWHNLSTQIGNEGELANEQGRVLNPALLVIEISEKVLETE